MNYYLTPSCTLALAFPLVPSPSSSHPHPPSHALAFPLVPLPSNLPHVLHHVLHHPPSHALPPTPSPSCTPTLPVWYNGSVWWGVAGPAMEVSGDLEMCQWWGRAWGCAGLTRIAGGWGVPSRGEQGWGAEACELVVVGHCGVVQHGSQVHGDEGGESCAMPTVAMARALLVSKKPCGLFDISMPKEKEKGKGKGKAKKKKTYLVPVRMQWCAYLWMPFFERP